PANDRDDDAGDAHDGDRINHRRLDLRVQLDRLLDVLSESLKNRVENTACLTGGDHVREEIVEDFRMLAHRVGQTRAGLDVLPDLNQRTFEYLVILLATEDLEALDERETGVDHYGELPREDRDRLRRNFAAELRDGDLFALLFDGGDDDLLPPH